MDVKREIEFELDMLDDRNDRLKQREEVRLQEMRDKIEVLKLNQEKIKQESKCCIVFKKVVQLSIYGITEV